MELKEVRLNLTQEEFTTVSFEANTRTRQSNSIISIRLSNTWGFDYTVNPFNSKSMLNQMEWQIVAFDANGRHVPFTISSFTVTESTSWFNRRIISFKGRTRKRFCF